ncbi:hypothetical protein [Alkalibacterium kapii]|uniref:Uncharacterized protein n=1 Tax=Alkalibacterium kapii TaxID=426704 RepID=A0A511AXS1_9LACT|nr:hypothetical protein [Alkalibacterium kapii]GEK91931.1 hypothetical protein AKA01nite_15530 [Alkalibacterium kapii]
MGLFDFFKNKKVKPDSSAKNTLQDNDQHTLKHEMQLNEKDFNTDKETIAHIVEKMIQEDPFKNYFSGMTKEDMNARSERYYKYSEITTVNVDFTKSKDQGLVIKIEGISLGILSPEKAQTLESHQDNYLLTAFVYVTGGPFMAYDSTKEVVVEDEEPLGLDIFVQFT